MTVTANEKFGQKRLRKAVLALWNSEVLADCTQDIVAAEPDAITVRLAYRVPRTDFKPWAWATVDHHVRIPYALTKAEMKKLIIVTGIFAEQC